MTVVVACTHIGRAHTNLQAYQEQRPLEEVRLKLLRDAGIAAVSELRKPDRPVFRVKISKPHFRVMLYHGIHLLRRMEEDHEATAAFLGLEGDVDDIHQLLLEFNDAKQSSRNIAMLDKELSSMAVGGGGGGGLPSSPSKAALSSQRSVSKLGLTSQASFGALGGSGRLKSPSPLRRSGSSVASKLAASTPTAAAGASARSGGNMTPKAPLAPVAELSRSGRL